MEHGDDEVAMTTVVRPSVDEGSHCAQLDVGGGGWLLFVLGKGWLIKRDCKQD